MTSAKSDARWSDAIVVTVTLWVFVMLIFLPVIFERYAVQDWRSIALDNSTFLACIVLGLGVFAVFRKSQNWPVPIRVVAMAVAVLGAAVLQTFYDMLFQAVIELRVVGLTMTPPYEKIFRYLLVFMVNLVLFQLAASRRSSQRGQLQLMDARSAAQTAHLEALRYQINPHFLFNTLNSISALIVTRRNEDAEEMTSKLSNFLRSTLTSDPAGLVPLDEELVHIEEYLDIEAVRFGDRLNAEIDCDTIAGDVLIPSFLIQPLVENAIKHGVAPSRDPVTVSIRAHVENGQLTILVENDRLPLVETISIGTGVGLANVRQRLAAVYGTSATLTTDKDDGMFRARVSVPTSTSISLSS